MSIETGKEKGEGIETGGDEKVVLERMGAMASLALPHKKAMGE